MGSLVHSGCVQPQDAVILVMTSVTCVFDRKYVTCQSIGFPNRTEVIDQLVCTDSGVILCRYTAYSKQYTGKNKDQFVSVQHSLSSGFPVIILLLPGLSG